MTFHTRVLYVVWIFAGFFFAWLSWSHNNGMKCFKTLIGIICKKLLPYYVFNLKLAFSGYFEQSWKAFWTFAFNFISRCHLHCWTEVPKKEGVFICFFIGIWPMRSMILQKITHLLCVRTLTADIGAK